MQVSTSYVQIRGKLEVEKPYLLGDLVNVDLTVTGILYLDNDDGSQDCVYKAKLWSVNEK